MKPFEWNEQEDGGVRVFGDNEWPDDDLETGGEGEYDGFYSHDCMEDDDNEDEYPPGDE
jgi:hypothetical protein